MPDLTNQIIAWVAFLVLAVPYVMWAKHPATKPLAAYLIFVTIVSVAGWVIYSLVTVLLAGLLAPEAQGQPALPIAAFVLSLVLGIILAHWQIRKAPRESPRI